MPSLCFFKKIVKIFVIGNVEQVPVVQTGAFELAVVDFKSQRFHQMQRSACGGAGTRDVAGVLRNLRLDQYDIQQSDHPADFDIGRETPCACQLLYVKCSVKST